MTAEGYDVLVIGGGHAGAEAAWAAAHLGARTALVTFSRDAIGRLSCNPAIGGIGKGQIVREIDALGGLMGLVADEAGIQFRMLNQRKGPAVWAPRAQADHQLYVATLRRYLQSCPNLTTLEAGVEAVETRPSSRGTSDKQVTGVQLADGTIIAASAVVVACGTFLRGLMHCGESKTPGGRIGENAAVGLSESLRKLGLELARLKTGTPPRVARSSVDFSRLREQPGDPEPAPFSFMTDRLTQPQVCCWLAQTNPAVHDLIRANLQRAPMYSGQIQSRGPRYCPSIEDKVVRFAEKDRHQIFLEPEGRDSNRIYLNGISTSLPCDVQHRMVTLIEGLEQAHILQWGYAVEYDFVPPEQIDATLMTKRIRGLFLAGQINGTSGYEEAAGQGLVAGINAARLAAGEHPITIGRDEGYIGVMIDDLVTRGVTEPYRMFTSRAEHRMHLRYDNADARLTPLGREVGLVDDARWERFRNKSARLADLRAALGRLRWEGRPIRDWLKRPEEDGERFAAELQELADYRRETDVWTRVLVEIRYGGYLERQQRVIDGFRRLEEREIPPETDYTSIAHLRREAAERWSAVRPRSVGQAARVSGVHPTDVSLLLVHLARPDREPVTPTGKRG
ncbi:MAG TPA: tRNA uridine-5-carboxymethylaminomethyl(34) synthesis enzyme MnmG [Phycisphaerae bacterium]|nr:tRNA uridine-5-carboxymethylaminomethyl(34) synthesis enzyme MnmG [Phycisphaerae bacterium]